MTKELKLHSGKKDCIVNKSIFNWRSASRIQIDALLSSCTKFTSKWIKDLYIKPDILKLIIEKVEKSLEYMGKGEIFLNRTPMVYALRSRNDKWYLIKLQNFCKTKATVCKDKMVTNRFGKDLY